MRARSHSEFRHRTLEPLRCSPACGSGDQVEVDFGAVSVYSAITQQLSELPNGGNGLVLFERELRKAVDFHSHAPMNSDSCVPILSQTQPGLGGTAPAVGLPGNILQILEGFCLPVLGINLRMKNS